MCECQFGAVQCCLADDGQWVAIKALSRRHVQEGRRQARVLREIHLMKIAAPHPCLIEWRGVEKTADTLYIVMEACVAGDLFSWRSTSSSSVADAETSLDFSATHVQYLIGCMASALVSLHAQHIVHRDVKPENVVVDARGCPKLIDFGFAKHVYDQTRTHVGTPAYMSPEVVLRQWYAHDADVWSLGVLAYECMYAHTPFFDEDDEAEQRNIVECKYQFPPLVAPASSSASVFRSFVASILTRERSDRLRVAAWALEHEWLKTARPYEARTPPVAPDPRRIASVETVPWTYAQEAAHPARGEGGEVPWDLYA